MGRPPATVTHGQPSRVEGAAPRGRRVCGEQDGGARTVNTTERVHGLPGSEVSAQALSRFGHRVAGGASCPRTTPAASEARCGPTAGRDTAGREETPAGRGRAGRSRGGGGRRQERSADLEVHWARPWAGEARGVRSSRRGAGRGAAGGGTPTESPRAPGPELGSGARSFAVRRTAACKLPGRRGEGRSGARVQRRAGARLRGDGPRSGAASRGRSGGRGCHDRDGPSGRRSPAASSGRRPGGRPARLSIARAARRGVDDLVGATARHEGGGTASCHRAAGLRPAGEALTSPWVDAAWTAGARRRDGVGRDGATVLGVTGRAGSATAMLSGARWPPCVRRGARSRRHGAVQVGAAAPGTRSFAPAGRLCICIGIARDTSRSGTRSTSGATPGPGAAAARCITGTAGAVVFSLARLSHGEAGVVWRGTQVEVPTAPKTRSVSARSRAAARTRALPAMRKEVSRSRGARGRPGRVTGPVSRDHDGSACSTWNSGSSGEEPRGTGCARPGLGGAIDGRDAARAAGHRGR